MTRASVWLASASDGAVHCLVDVVSASWWRESLNY